MSASSYASDLIRSMRSKLRDAGHGGLLLRSEDAIAWERQLNTVLALVEELEAESTMLANGLEARMRAEERGGRPRLRLVSSNDDGPDHGGSAA